MSPPKHPAAVRGHRAALPGSCGTPRCPRRLRAPLSTPVTVPPPQTGAAREAPGPATRPNWLCPVVDGGCHHRTNPSIPTVSPCRGLAMSPLYRHGSKTWLRPTKLMSPGSWPLRCPLGWLGTNRGGAGAAGTPPSPTPEPQWCPRGRCRVPAPRSGSPSALSPHPNRPRPLPVSLSQQRETSPDGSCGRVVTATLLQDFTRIPAFGLKKTRSPRSLARRPPRILPGLGLGEWHRGMGPPQPRWPGATRWGGGRGDTVTAGSASWEQLGAPGATPLDVGLGVRWGPHPGGGWGYGDTAPGQRWRCHPSEARPWQDVGLRGR